MGPSLNGTGAIYRFVHPSEGFRYVLPARPDDDNVPYRLDVILTLLKLIDRGDVRVVVLAGHDAEEMRHFIIEPLISFFKDEKIFSRHIGARARIDIKGLSASLETDPPRVLLLEWTQPMATDEGLTDLLNRSFFNRKDRRLIVIHHQSAAFPNDVKAPAVLPFIERLSVPFAPVVGLLPQFMSELQASNYVFGRAGEAAFRLAKLVSSSVPLIHPMLKHVKASLGGLSYLPLPEDFQRSLNPFIPEEGIFLASGGRVWREALQPSGVVQSIRGFESFQLRTNSSPADAMLPGSSILTIPQIMWTPPPVPIAACQAPRFL